MSARTTRAQGIKDPVRQLAKLTLHRHGGRVRNSWLCRATSTDPAATLFFSLLSHKRSILFETYHNWQCIVLILMLPWHLPIFCQWRSVCREKTRYQLFVLRAKSPFDFVRWNFFILCSSFYVLSGLGLRFSNQGLGGSTGLRFYHSLPFSYCPSIFLRLCSTTPFAVH